MLESCSLASWLLDPRVDARTRVGRVFAIRHEGMEQQLKCIRADGGDDNDLQPTMKRIEKVEQDALELGYSPIVNAKGRRVGIGQKMPSATEVIKLMLDEEVMYRILSAVAHGHNWAIRWLSFKPAPEGALRPDVGGVPATMFEKTVDIDRLALLGLTAAKAFAKPVLYECRYFAWDEERFIALLDSTFDKLQAGPGVRFWHNE